MLSAQDLSDYKEIEMLAITYANALDTRQFHKLDDVFTPDAYIDYRAMEGIDGDFKTIRAWLPEALAKFPSYYHMIGNHEIHLAGDSATGRVTCFNPMVVDIGGGKTQTGLLGLWYVDKYVRTPKGWRIADRREEHCFTHNFPKM